MHCFRWHSRVLPDPAGSGQLLPSMPPQPVLLVSRDLLTKASLKNVTIYFVESLTLPKVVIFGIKQ